ncbi:MAG: response regulator [Nitrospirae bacterium]|nr:MAG: response regulator [Nitrospirota bacterium]
MKAQPRPILVIEDDPVDREMIELAFKRAAVENPVVTVSDGQEALDYLGRKGRFGDRRGPDAPALIVLDLDMPLMNGFEFLSLIRAQPGLAAIPVVVLTTSEYNGDLGQSYALGANSCITKPGDFEQLVEIARAIGGYWCRINRAPEGR